MFRAQKVAREALAALLTFEGAAREMATVSFPRDPPRGWNGHGGDLLGWSVGVRRGLVLLSRLREAMAGRAW